MMIKRIYRLAIFCLMIFCSMNMNAQQSIKNYEVQWKKVDELVKKRLPQ